MVGRGITLLSVVWNVNNNTILKTFMTKTLRNVTQQHFAKKSFAKEGLACMTD